MEAGDCCGGISSKGIGAGGDGSDSESGTGMGAGTAAGEEEEAPRPCPAPDGDVRRGIVVLLRTKRSRISLPTESRRRSKIRKSTLG